MNMNETKRVAKGQGIKTDKLAKVALVRQIQLSHGNFDCFSTAYEGTCNQTDYIWRDDCSALARKHKH